LFHEFGFELSKISIPLRNLKARFNKKTTLALRAIGTSKITFDENRYKRFNF
jgi:hypothetical protein